MGNQEKLVDLLREAFQNWHKPILPNNSLRQKLASSVEKQRWELDLDDSPYGCDRALRHVIQAGIKLLAPDGGKDPPCQENDPKWYQREWIYYNILTLSLVSDTNNKYVMGKTGCSGGDFYHKKKEALETLAYVLLDEEGSPSPLEFPSGAIIADSKFYIERQADADLEIIPSLRQTFIIRGPRQVGKTSLLIRGTKRMEQQYAAKVIRFDFQSIDRDHLASLDSVLYQLAHSIVSDLGLDTDNVKQIWKDNILAPTRKIYGLLDKNVLPAFDVPIILALDEVDRLLLNDFREDFFAMLRAWHNSGASVDHWRKLNLILVISTEPYLLINNPYQSPFNVGYKLSLDDFNDQQVSQLNQLYGSPLQPEELPSLMYLLNGHPYLTRVALYTMKKENLTWSGLERIAVSDSGPFTDHLRHIQSVLSNEPNLGKIFKQIIKGENCSDEHAQFRLLKAGLIKKKKEAYVCRCYLYHQYFA
jgi:hypothetical protein